MSSTHRRRWRKHHGPIPEGCVIHHINGDRKDNRLENLQMMTRLSHHLLHKKWREQAEDNPALTACTWGSAARRSGIFYDTIRSWVCSGRLTDATPPCGKPRLVTTDSVKKLLAERKRSPIRQS